jgi:two-component system, OmpR family, response regulator
VPPSAPSAPPRGAPSPCVPHLLIVEDDLDTAVMLRLVFQQGYRVTLAGDLAQARAALAAAGLPNLVLLDVMLPDGDGRDFCRALKGRHPQIAVILMTAYARAGVVIEAHAHACGADGFAPKPFDVEALRATAARLVRRLKAG